MVERVTPIKRKAKTKQIDAKNKRPKIEIPAYEILSPNILYFGFNQEYGHINEGPLKMAGFDFDSTLT